MIGIVDYNAGNIKSVERALDYLKAPYILSKNPADLKDVDRVIFPGDGEAASAMRELVMSGYDSFLRDWAAANKPLLGICIGAQIIFDQSEECGSGNATAGHSADSNGTPAGGQNYTQCLGLIPGTIRHFAKLWHERDIDPEDNSRKVPHMGWNDVTFNGRCPILKGVPDGSDFYFVHSYVIQPKDPAVIKGFANYGTIVPAVIQSKKIFACQFHPEKSGKAGLQILKNFVEGDL